METDSLVGDKRMTASPKARICTWVDLSLTDVEHLLRASETTEALQQALGDILRLGDAAASSKQALIELDLYTYAILFARKQDFSADQVSAFFTMLKCVHCMCISTPFDNFQETFQYFKELLLKHSVNRPPYSTCLFSISQVKTVSDYVLASYFKHFKLYKYAFTKRVHLNLKFSYPGVPDSPEPSEVEETQEGGVDTTAEDQLEEEEGEKDTENEGDASPTGGGEEEQPLSSEQQHLKQLIASTLTDKMKELQVAVEREMGDQEKKLSERICALEATAEGKSKSKNKKGK